MRRTKYRCAGRAPPKRHANALSERCGCLQAMPHNEKYRKRQGSFGAKHALSCMGSPVRLAGGECTPPAAVLVSACPEAPVLACLAENPLDLADSQSSESFVRKPHSTGTGSPESSLVGCFYSHGTLVSQEAVRSSSRCYPRCKARAFAAVILKGLARSWKVRLSTTLVASLAKHWYID